MARYRLKLERIQEIQLRVLHDGQVASVYPMCPQGRFAEPSTLANNLTALLGARVRQHTPVHNIHARSSGNLSDTEQEVAHSHQAHRHGIVAHLLHHVRSRPDVAAEKGVHRQARPVHLKVQLHTQGVGNVVDQVDLVFGNVLFTLRHAEPCVAHEPNAQRLGDVVLLKVAAQEFELLRLLATCDVQLRHRGGQHAHEDRPGPEAADVAEEGIQRLGGVSRLDLVHAAAELRHSPSHRHQVLVGERPELKPVVHNPIRIIICTGSSIPQASDDVCEPQHDHLKLQRVERDPHAFTIKPLKKTAEDVAHADQAQEADRSNNPEYAGGLPKARKPGKVRQEPIDEQL
mmetsp:Transcript_1598/g.4567  ORF Transcript_1598/g.4567 Transcript_1598/m.4567 type:complete len:345 (+) Transcript_1598:315-1349(+)